MGSASANISTSGSSVNKGESLLDTARTIDMMGTDIIIMRHNQSGAPHFIAPYLKASVVNAGDGMNEHPTQALLDMFTIYEKLGTLEGKKVALSAVISITQESSDPTPSDFPSSVRRSVYTDRRP